MAASSALPAGNWSPFPGQPGDYIETDPNDPDEQVTYDTANGQYDVSNPYQGVFGPDASSISGAQSDFNSKYPTASGKTAAATTPQNGGSGTTAPGGSALQPTYLSTLFPNGIPQASAAQVSNVPQVGAPSTSSIVSAINAGLQPQFAQQDQAETEALANAGIVGGSTTGAMGALGVQQQQQEQAADAPYILQGDQMQQTAEEANQGAAINTGEYNAGSQNSTNEYNLSNLINSGMYDSTLGANQEDTLAGFENQDYLAQLGLQGNVITTGEGGQTGAYQPIYEQPTGTSTSGLGSALGSYASNPGTIATNPNEEDYEGDSEANAYNPYGATVGGD